MSKNEITPDLVEKVAFLARIKLQPAEVQRYTEDLKGVFNWLEQLNEVNFDDVELEDNVPTLLREDAITDGNKLEDIVHNAPQQNFGMFSVPKVVE